MKKKITSAFMAVVMAAALSLTASAHPGKTDANGGHYDRKNGTYHYHNNGTSSSSSSKPTTKKTARWEGDKYWNGSSYAKGWTNINGKNYYFDNLGKLTRNKWLKTNNGYYFVDENGVMCTGWKKINDKTYYLGNDGVMRTNWRKIGDYTYCFGSDGAMKTGWYKNNNNTYYFRSNGTMVTGKVKIGETTYSFNENGVLQSSGSTNSSTASSGQITWGMSVEEVIAAKGFKDYEISDPVLIAYDTKPNLLYWFDEIEGLSGYGSCTAYSESQLKAYRTHFEKNGWTCFVVDEPQYFLYEKNGQITMISYDYDKKTVSYVTFSKKYSEPFLNNAS